MKLKCKNCENIWDYKGNNHYFATCPNCLRKVSLKSRRYSQSINENKED